jgi:hypothetical protein
MPTHFLYLMRVDAGAVGDNSRQGLQSNIASTLELTGKMAGGIIEALEDSQTKQAARNRLADRAERLATSGPSRPVRYGGLSHSRPVSVL